jgi:cysteinyl-tRNA synthetase
MGDLTTAASTFRLLNIDADPGVNNFTVAQIATLRAGGQNTVVSYLNVGACEMFRSWWQSAPAPYVSCSSSNAQLGPYQGYPDEVWMDPSDPQYQALIVSYIAPLLAATGVDGFFLDNLEIVEHGPDSSDGPCNSTCAQGGLDIVRQLRDAFPGKVIILQNGLGTVTMNGVTGGLPFPSLLDGISAEETYTPSYDMAKEAELLAWKALGLTNSGHPLSITTEDYVGNCTDTQTAMMVYSMSRARGFSPYVTISSANQNQVCYWGL